MGMELEDPLGVTSVVDLPFVDFLEVVELAGIEVVRVDEKPVSVEW